MVYVVVYITCPEIKEAERISKILLDNRLAACVNVIPNVTSFFWWAGKKQKSEELMLMVKTKKNLLRKIVKKVKEIHQYENPEIIAIPIIGGSKEYTDWIEEETGN
ncbi:MAG: divalent-cation tolerance protein CutA [Candidatus Aenigmarchaeota archaeon]|nr:divalent-cation tolerance protein CutA [Candidatus Aenigmarchaeota archaeon]